MSSDKQYQGTSYNPQAISGRACNTSCSTTQPIYQEDAKRGIKLNGIVQIVCGTLIFLAGLTCCVLSHVYSRIQKSHYPWSNFKLSDPDHWRAPGTYTGAAVFAAGVCGILSVSRNRFTWVRSAMISHYVVLGMIWMVIAGSIQSLVELFRGNNCVNMKGQFGATVCALRFVSMGLHFLLLILAVISIVITACNVHKIRCQTRNAARTQQQNTVSMTTANGTMPMTQPALPPPYQTNYGLQGDKPQTPPPGYPYGEEKQQQPA